jgi:hypothetical protein
MDSEAAQGQEAAFKRSDDGWRTARDRLMSYLDAAGVPPLEGLAMSLEVVEEVRERCNCDEQAEPVGASLQVARRLLREKQRIDDDHYLLTGDADLVRHPLPARQVGSMKPQSLGIGRGKGLLKRVSEMTKFLLPLFMTFIRIW